MPDERTSGNEGDGYMQTLLEFWNFFKERKKWWLLPMIVVLLLIGILIVFSSGSAVAPFVYTLF
jgi:NAD/NADP transhydrogenase beta subunit